MVVDCKLSKPDLKVLLVDDLGSARKILIRYLKDLGIRHIEEASNGLEAFEKVSGGGFDIVISDWEMPKMTGLELLKKIRSDQNLSALPFIMITSHNKREMVIEAAEAGISDYLSKPFSETVLVEKIENSLKKPILKLSQT